VKLAHVEELLADRDARRPAVLLRWLESGEASLVHAASELDDAALAEAIEDALAADQACTLETGDGTVFVQPFNPSLRMVIIGAVHIAQHLAPLASGVGYAVCVIDPRAAFATPDRFPEVALSHDWPDVALAEHGLDARTAVITLSHDPKLDDPALRAALDSDAFYIGSLGSRANHARRLDRLRERGFDDAALGRIHGPVGLDIGARSPAEIAISILAEATARLRGRS